MPRIYHEICESSNVLTRSMALHVNQRSKLDIESKFEETTVLRRCSGARFSKVPVTNRAR